MIATVVTQYRGKNQRAWLDVSGKELDVLRTAPDLYDFRTVYVPAGEPIDELKAFQNFKSMRGEAAGYEGDGCFGFIVQDQWAAWQHRADMGIVAVVAPQDSDTAGTVPAEGAAKDIELRIAVSVGATTTKVKIFNGANKAFEQELDTPERTVSLTKGFRFFAGAIATALLFSTVFLVLSCFSPEEKQPAAQSTQYVSPLDERPAQKGPEQ